MLYMLSEAGNENSENQNKDGIRTTLSPYKSDLKWTFWALQVPNINVWQNSSCRKRIWRSLILKYVRTCLICF